MYIPLENGEEIIAQVHKHWWFIALRVVLVILVASMPFVLWLFLHGLGWLDLVDVPLAAMVSLGALWLLVVWILFWQFWTLYYMDMWIVTNKRLIDIDYIAFFNRNIAILRLDRIQDLTVDIDSVFGDVLGFGSLLVQTAGSDREFRVENISHPEKLRDLLSHYAGQISVH